MGHPLSRNPEFEILELGVFPISEGYTSVVSFQAEREQSSFGEILINKKKEINVLETTSVDTESCSQVTLTL